MNSSLKLHVMIFEPVMTFDPAYDKTYTKTCVISANVDQPVHPLNMARDLVYASLDRVEAVKNTCDQ